MSDLLGPDAYSDEDDLPEGTFTLAEVMDAVGGLSPELQKVVAQSIRRSVLAHVAYPEADKTEKLYVDFERRKLRARRTAQEMEQADLLGVTEAASRLTTGGAFIHDLPAEVPIIWGHGKGIV